MIHESYYWKKELYDSFRTLAIARHGKRKTELGYVNIEKAILIGAYVVRKLDEAQKIPPQFLKEMVTLAFYVNESENIDHMNSHRFDKNYNLQKEQKETRDVAFIVDQLIHSFNLVYCFEDGKFSGVLVNSDHTKSKKLFNLPLEFILKLFLKISEGDITSSHWTRIRRMDSSGELVIGPARLENAVYSYDLDEDIDIIVRKAMEGEIYKRQAGR